MTITSFLKYCLFHLGFYSFIRKLFPHNGVSILRYHAIVNPEQNYYASPSIVVSVKAFEKHVQYFSKKYNIISMDDVLKHLNEKHPFPPNSIVFTFDDGYADNFDAYKILKKYNTTGTFYLTVGCIGNKESLWLFEIIYLIKNTRKNYLSLKINKKNLSFSLKTKEDKKKAINQIMTLIKSNNIQAREDIRRQLREKLNVPKLERVSKKVMLTWQQVKAMVKDGMTIGGHTMTHCNLPNAGIKDAKNEIMECKRILEQKLGVKIKHFSYPNSGDYEYFNKEIKKLVSEAGFKTAVTSENGFVTPNSDLLELKRVRVTENLWEIIHFLEIDRLIGYLKSKYSLLAFKI